MKIPIEINRKWYPIYIEVSIVSRKSKNFDNEAGGYELCLIIGKPAKSGSMLWISVVVHWWRYCPSKIIWQVIYPIDSGTTAVRLIEKWLNTRFARLLFLKKARKRWLIIMPVSDTTDCIEKMDEVMKARKFNASSAPFTLAIKIQ